MKTEVVEGDHYEMEADTKLQTHEWPEADLSEIEERYLDKYLLSKV